MPQVEGKRNNYFDPGPPQVMSLISKDFYSTAEFAALQGVTVKSVHRWVQKGQAPTPERFAGSYWFEKKAVDAWHPPKSGPRKKNIINRRG